MTRAYLVNREAAVRWYARNKGKEPDEVNVDAALRSYETALRLSREAKRRRRGVCERCGAETRYGGLMRHGRTGVSRFCVPCGRDVTRERMVLTRGTGTRGQQVLSLLAERPYRFLELAQEIGVTKNCMGQLLHRLRAYGLVERPERGLYVLTEAGREKLR